MLKWRPGIIYAYSVLDPKTRRREPWGYVGQTRQTLVARHNQHMAAQPWSDLSPDIRVIFYFPRCPDWFLTLAEKWTIWFTRPLYNYEYNTKNPRRIPKYQAVDERNKRNLRRGRRRARVRP